MPIAPYQRVLAIPGARNTLLLGLFVRIPMFAGAVLLTFHVVQSLERSYTQAGLVSTAATVCIAVSGPWRGRLLDRRGLRRVVLPSLLVVAACWAIAPFSDYLPLLLLAALAGLFNIPTFSIIRQAVIVAVPERDRKTALALDSVAVELSFMIGPVVGIWAATVWPTSWVLFGIEMSGVLAGIGLWLANPPLTADGALARGATPRAADGALAGGAAPKAADGALAGGAAEPGVSTGGGGARDPRPARVPRREWFTSGYLALCVAAAGSTIVLTGADIGIIAALREFGQSPLIGSVFAIWGVGSILGGLVYGALHRSIPAFGLLAGLSLATLPLALATDIWALATLVFVAGLLCAPTITATVDQISYVVPERALGEAMGWHGSFMTAGSALGAPIGGAAIDLWGFRGGFVAVGVVGLVIAAVVAAVTGARRRTRTRTRAVELPA